MSSKLEGVAWAAAIVLLSGAFYEALVALEVLPIGDEPGEGARGSDLVLVAAMLAYLTAAVICVAHAVAARSEARPVWIALAPVGAVYLVARWYTFDPYYLPTLRRYADGEIHGWWIAVVSLAAVSVASLTLRLPRGGAVWSSVVLLVTALTVWLLPIGK